MRAGALLPRWNRAIDHGGLGQSDERNLGSDNPGNLGSLTGFPWRPRLGSLSNPYPSWCMIAGPILATHVPVNASIREPGRCYRIQKQMIECQPCIARPTLPLIVPEREHRLRRMHRLNGIDPSYAATTSRGRLVRFYRRFGFVIEKAKPPGLTITPTMSRKPVR